MLKNNFFRKVEVLSVPPSPHGLHWTLSSESPQPSLSISYMNGLDWSGVESTGIHFRLLSPENPTGSGLDSSGLQL